MSGGGGGGGPGGGFEPAGDRTPCDQLKFRTSVASPQPAADALNNGDVLRVVLEPGPPVVIHLVDGNGDVVGSLITRVADLLRCIQDGFSYEADVRVINGGDFQVDVRLA
ncbi:MAG: hypothetical protein ACJ76D_04175 [Solirubrobacterales bacterium]